MNIIYEQVTERGIEIPLALCRMAQLTDQAVISVREGRIEVQSLGISREHAEALANRYIATNPGDSLVAGEATLVEDTEGIIWQVPVLHSRTRERKGRLLVNGMSGTVVHFTAE
jgi:hypothetical protein